MSQDEILKTALSGYEITADKLSRGEKVSEDELRKFQGLTAMLLVKMMRQLWTQEELEDQIDKRVEAKCQMCPNSKALGILMDSHTKQATPPPAAPESPQNIRTMLATSLANRMTTAIVSAAAALVIVVLGLGAMVIYTRQIPEAAGAAQVLKSE